MMKIVATNVVASHSPERRPTATPTARANASLAVPWALYHRLQHCTACKMQIVHQGAP